MIKLFWNTHNQNQQNENNKKKDVTDSIWGLYHKENSDQWIYELLKEVDYKIINDENSIEKKDTLIIVDSSIEKKISQYKKLKSACSKIFLFHLGDESGIYDTSSVYDICDFIWRGFCSNRYFKNKKVKCIPIGFKSGVIYQNIKKRKYKWSFIGTPHKSSRHDLLFQLSKIENFFCHKTEQFNKKIITAEQMSGVLSSTEFIPCPNGFVHPETYRLYEALECSCIPIVENAYQYYDRLFPNNPFIKVDKWSEAKNILQNLEKNQIVEKREACKNWWNNYKIATKNLIKNKIVK